MSYIEEDCTITIEGKSFTANGAIVNGRAIVYAYEREGKVGNWHGTMKVSAHYGREWVSNFGDRRQSVEFTWDGHAYAGTYYKSSGDLIRARQVK